MNEGVRTLGIDVGGSGIKAAVLGGDAMLQSDRKRIDTPYPSTPERLVQAVVKMRDQAPPHDRVSVGFPGLIRSGRVVFVGNLSRRTLEGEIDPELVDLWRGFDLQAALEEAFDVPVRVANDADVQGCAVVTGHGFEVVVTLGTGIGTALFYEGALLPHIELGHAPFPRGDESVEEVVGNAGRKAHGNEKWAKHVLEAIEAYRSYLFFDTMYLGGGNAKRLDPAVLPTDVKIVPNSAGITGGVRLWELEAR